ncbi:MAG: hypothetical protein AAGG48_09855 [Planctomycetota bacterium]
MSEAQPSYLPLEDMTSVTGWRKLARVGLFLYVIGLLGYAGYQFVQSGNPPLAEEAVEETPWIVQSVVSVGRAALWDFGRFLLLGFLCGAACGSSQWGVSIFRVIASVIMGFVLAVIVAVTANGLIHGPPISPPSPLSVVVILVGCLWGNWLGATWMNSGGTFGWAFRQMALTIVVLLGAAGTLAWKSLSKEPLDIASETVSTEDRRRLVNLFREHDPRKLEEDEITEMTITQEDVNKLAAWGLSLVPGENRAEVELLDQQVAVRATGRIPVLDRYVNVVSTGSLKTREGELVYRPVELRLGSLSVPSSLFQLSGPLVLDEEWQRGPVEPFFQSFESIEIGDQVAKVSYGRLEVDKAEVRNTLIDMGVLEDLEEPVNAQVKNLIAFAEQTPAIDFAQCVQTAFQFAQDQSEEGDAVLQNRSAILALAYLLGHPKVRPLVGELDQPPAELRQKFNGVKLRNRRDWTQHFTISAALQVFGNRSASLDVGILKEELDADGGSGFSFGDLLADRAGTMLAYKATESEGQAIAMQKRIVAGLDESDVMPAGDDLPEGLADEVFQEEFGGVGGPEYTKLLVEIDRRIDELAGYRN